ncbi:MAG: flagellar assembly protein FliX, partial [Caulobacteraceae bacterium]
GKAAGAGAAKPGARAASGGFSLGGAAAASDARPTSGAFGVSGVASLDALLALQQVETATERRKRAVRRAGRILDALDGLKLALLDGGVSTGTLHSLTNSVREARAETDDPGLDGILREVDVRAAVELAKLAKLQPSSHDRRAA